MRRADLWVGESGPTWDAFAPATAVGQATSQIAMTVGPLPVAVRDPATITRAAGSVAAPSGRPVGVALGTSSTRVVEGIHHRSRAHSASVLAESAEALARSLRDPEDEQLQAHGFRRRLPPAGGRPAVAAFGDRAIAVAARYADAMLLDLVSPAQLTEVLPGEAAHTVGLVGDLDSVHARLQAYAEAGLEEIALLPATAADDQGRHTLSALAPGEVNSR